MARAIAASVGVDDCAMAKKSVFIGNLPISADSSALKMFIQDHISCACTCRTCYTVTKTICESEGAVEEEWTEQKKYAFVAFGTPDEASACVEAVHGKLFQGRSLCAYAAEDSPYEKRMKSFDERDLKRERSGYKP